MGGSGDDDDLKRVTSNGSAAMSELSGGRSDSAIFSTTTSPPNGTTAGVTFAQDGMGESYGVDLLGTSMTRNAEVVDPWLANQKTELTGLKGKAMKIMSHKVYSVLMVFCTAWALFMLDIGQLLGGRSVDTAMRWGLFVVFIVFAVEIVLELWVQGRSYIEFYFWLDLFTTLSLLPDILVLFLDVHGDNALNVFTLARAGRAARASSRASRIIRFIKVLNARRLSSRKVNVVDFEVDDDVNGSVLRQSTIGARFTESTTRRVVLLVMVVLVLLAVLDNFTQTTVLNYDDAVVVHLQALASAMNLMPWNLFQTNFLAPFVKRFPEVLVLVLGVQGEGRTVVVDRESVLSTLRVTDVLTITDGPSGAYLMVLDGSGVARNQAITSIILVIGIVIILGLGNFLFIQKADQLIISPVERMTHIVRQLAHNPLTQLKTHLLTANGETGTILQMLAKLVGLVQAGFGEAGSAIIAANMAEGGSVDVMKPGKKMRGIFGFCDIRNFTDITEVLNERCMLLVNSIADILHSNVHSRMGSANKNIGDAFLLVWKLDKPQRSSKKLSAVNSTLSGGDSNSLVAGNALCAFLATYNDMVEKKNERLNALQRKCQGISFEMGYGLHVGWAIEGAIGSRFKIDASYLSPHVNTSSRLESLTKHYSCPILLSGEFVALLAEPWRARLRMIDAVSVKGSSKALEVYTLDDLSRVEDPMNPPAPHTTPRITHRDIHREGMTSFRAGDWEKAAERWRAYHASTNDVPTKVLLDYIAEQKAKSPAGWLGHRILTSK